MDLFIGSEGTLGVITKAVLKLYPKPGSSATLIIPFESAEEAIDAVSKIGKSGIIPLALEYIEYEWICASAQHLSLKWPCENGKAQLMLIISENSEETVYAECERVDELFAGKEIYMAERREEQEDVLKIRSNIYTALKEHILDTLDLSVPPAEIGRMIELVHTIEKEYDTVMPVYGHAADGNLHIHIMDDAEERFHEIKERMYAIAHELGGVMTAEHGIGKARVRDMKKFMDKKELELMKSIKRTLDPENIMNPETLIGDDA